MKQLISRDYYKGFTMIEFMMVLAMLGIVVALILPVIMDKKESNSSTVKSDGTQCIRGYVFVRSNNELKQLLSVNGGGVLCQN